MRVTNSMLTNRVAFNMRNSVGRFLELQTKMSSGRRINKPSDDPLGILRDLDYRTELSKNSQYQKNITQGLNWMQTYDTLLNEANNMIVSATMVAEAMANGTIDADLRASVATEIKSTIEQIMQMANSEHEGKHIFSGFETDHKSLIGAINGVYFNGDHGMLEFKIESSTNMQVNLNAADVFLAQLKTLGEEADLNVAVTGTTNLIDLNRGNGVSLATGLITIDDNNLGLSSTIDLSGAVTVDDIITTVNNQLVADGITNLTLGVGVDGNNFTFDTVKNDLITALTDLNVLNDGNGVDQSTFGKFILTDGASINVTVDLQSASTIGDVITLFNNQVTVAGVSNVTMSINPAQNGLQIVDSNGIPLGLEILEGAVGSDLAANLGILGNVGATMIGSDLDPQVSFNVSENGDTTAADLGILGQFNYNFNGQDLNPNLTVNNNLTDLRNGIGFELGELQLYQGNLSKRIDLSSGTIITIQDLLDAFNNSGLDITASINTNGSGIQVVNNNADMSFTIEDVGNGRTSRDFKLFGSSDMMGALNVLVNSLEKDDYLGVADIMGTLQDATTHLLRMRASVGAKTIRLESTKTRLIDQEMTFTKHLSEVEDADITKLITDLSAYENNYQAALIASAKIIQPSLLDFMR